MIGSAIEGFCLGRHGGTVRGHEGSQRGGFWLMILGLLSDEPIGD